MGKLHAAARDGQADAAVKMIQAGADVNEVDNMFCTPLHYAARRGMVGVVKLLLHHHADPGPANNKGQTALYQAVVGGHAEITRSLVAAGADANVQTTTGIGALHFAARAGNIDILNILIGGGADVTAENKQGLTPKRIAVQYGHDEIVELLDKITEVAAPLVRPISTIAARVQRISDACEDGELDEEAALMEELEAIEIKMPVVSSVGSGKSRAGAGASAGGGGGGGKEASAQCQQQRKSKGGRAASASAPVSPAEVRKARGASTQATNGRRVSSGMAAKLGSELDSLFQAPGAFNSPLLGKKLASSVRPAPGAAGAFMPGAGNIAAGGAFASFASIPDSRAGGRILQPAPGLDNDPDGLDDSVVYAALDSGSLGPGAARVRPAEDVTYAEVDHGGQPMPSVGPSLPPRVYTPNEPALPPRAYNPTTIQRDQPRAAAPATPATPASGADPVYDTKLPDLFMNGHKAGAGNWSTGQPTAYVAGAFAKPKIQNAVSASGDQTDGIDSGLLAFLKSLGLLERCAVLAEEAGIITPDDFHLFSPEELVSTYAFKVGHVRKIFSKLEALTS